ncbi:tetratricopeptide repeat protein [Geomicrobium sp. JCM 19038]|uniref:response regulator aspartate phosphatase n=1 Tax=Geomicrobium sp. JCM 19038 TaxID=1460635 RepID=UPI00045F24B4|nr:tetratricopeptide repeat protein [Geomicrobium sp. JCM 19038]GAK07650.1 response regulator aspartate phosphatase [Geomicrobium sp. JCM 19038]
MLHEYSPATVGGEINLWYEAVKHNHRELAVQLKDKVSGMLEQMLPDHKVVTFYQLVSFKHDKFLDERWLNLPYYSNAPQPTDEMDCLLDFFSYYLHAESLMESKDYRNAFKYFSRAEDMINEIDDPAERAEFFFRFGRACYSLHLYGEAHLQLTKALTLYEQQYGYERAQASCKIYLSDVENWLGETNRASQLINEVLRVEENLGDLKPRVLGVSGLHAMKSMNYEEALKHFERAISDDEYATTIDGVQSKILLAVTYFFLEQDHHARLLLNHAEYEAKANNYENLLAICLILRGLHDYKDHTYVEEGLKLLSEPGLERVYYDTTVFISRYYEDLGQLDYALYFLKKTVNLKLMHPQLTLT